MSDVFYLGEENVDLIIVFNVPKSIFELHCI